MPRQEAKYRKTEDMCGALVCFSTPESINPLRRLLSTEPKWVPGVIDIELMLEVADGLGGRRGYYQGMRRTT